MAMVFKCDRCGEIYNYTPPDVNENRKSNAVIFIDNTPSGEQWRCDDQVLGDGRQVQRRGHDP